MTDLEPILNALAAGAAFAVSGAASAMTEQLYATLKARIRPYLVGSSLALDELEAREPDLDLLRTHLARTAASSDHEIQEAANKLFAAVGPVTAGPVNVSVQNSPGSVNPGVSNGQINMTHHHHHLAPLPPFKPAAS